MPVIILNQLYNKSGIPKLHKQEMVEAIETLFGEFKDFSKKYDAGFYRSCFVFFVY